MRIASPTRDLRFRRYLARRVRQLAGRLESLSTLDVRAGLSRHVVERADQADGEGAAFGLGATQAALAEEIGTVREVRAPDTASSARPILNDPALDLSRSGHISWIG